MSRQEQPDASSRNGLQRAILPAILLLAALARFAALDSFPDPVHFDEAQNASDGLYAISQGQPRPFYPANNGREGLFVNLVGLSLRAFGVNRFGLRLPSAIIGTAAVLLIFLLGRELFSRSVGLWAAFFLATSLWQVLFSRIGLRAILMPTLLIAAFLGLLRAWRTGRWSDALLGGVAFGLGFHSYLAFRIAPLIAAGLFVLDFFDRRRTQNDLRPWARLTGAWLAAAFVVALPMGLYFWNHPDQFTGRMDQLSVVGKQNALMTLATGFVKSSLMFFWKGDCNGWYNLACQPELPPPLAGLLLIGGVLGLAALASAARRTRFAFLFIWIFVMLLPAVFAWENITHALRAIGVIPPVFLLTAVGADALVTHLRTRQWLLFPALALILGSSLFEYYRYFVLWPRNPATAQFASAHLTHIAQFLNAQPETAPRIVIVNEYGQSSPADPAHPDWQVYLPAQTVVFLTRGHPTPEYLHVEDIFHAELPHGSIVVPLLEDSRLFQALRDRGFHITEEPHADFTAARVE